MGREHVRHFFRASDRITYEEKMTTKNFVKEAVQIAGGATRVAAQLKVSSRAVSTWQLQGFVPNYYRAEELAALANVPVSVLRRPS
ncbi:helix-turn-helix domain-containing protein [Pandoraea captiosa]|nr:helix-turn-helix domain-containing protein [Pandoraea captiosa]